MRTEDNIAYHLGKSKSGKTIFYEVCEYRYGSDYSDGQFVYGEEMRSFEGIIVFLKRHIGYYERVNKDFGSFYGEVEVRVINGGIHFPHDDRRIMPLEPSEIEKIILELPNLTIEDASQVK